MEKVAYTTRRVIALRVNGEKNGNTPQELVYKTSGERR